MLINNFLGNNQIQETVLCGELVNLTASQYLENR